MFPDSPYAVPRGSFERPVPLVFVDPCAEPTVTVRINRQWIPYVLGALQQLVLQATWKTDDPAALWLVQQRAMSLLSCVGLALDQPDNNDCCEAFPLNADIIDWAPINPYTEPDVVPAGYRFPPWYIVGNAIPFTGLQPGDVMTDLLHGPIVEPVSSGFPRFRIHCKGTGRVEISFVRFPTAGLALITVDDSVASTRWVDLHTSLVASIGAVEAIAIVPVEVTGIGDHHVDVTMIYSITEDPPFVHFGGGIRQIALCGFGVKPEPLQLISEMEYQMSVCEQLRVNNGIIEGLCCGEWTPISGQDGGFTPGGVTQPISEPRPPIAQSKCYNVLLNANNQWQLPFPVQDGDTISVTEIKGAWTDGAVNWYCAEGWPYILGQCVHSSRGHAGGDPDATDYHMQLIAKVGGAFFSATDGPFTIPGGTGTQSLTFQANDGTLGDNSGSMAFKVCVENGATPPATEWCYVFDFARSDYGWVAANNGSGALSIYTSGTGWQQTHGVDSPNDTENGIQISFAATEVTSVEVIYSATDTGNGGAREVLYQAGGGLTLYGNLNVGSGSFDTTISNDVPGTTLLRIQVDRAGAPFISTTNSRVIVKGKGTNPFGASNC